jgi:hypothetical protein
MHPWLTMETTGSTALSPGNTPLTQITVRARSLLPTRCRPRSWYRVSGHTPDLVVNRACPCRPALLEPLVEQRQHD